VCDFLDALQIPTWPGVTWNLATTSEERGGGTLGAGTMLKGCIRCRGTGLISGIVTLKHSVSGPHSHGTKTNTLTEIVGVDCG